MKAIPEIVLTVIFFICVGIIISNCPIRDMAVYVACLDFGVLGGRIWKWREIQ